MPEEYRVPHRMSVEPDRDLSFRWLYVGEKRFTEPFFEETISRCMGFPQNSSGSLPTIKAQELIAAAEAVDAVEPTAFVFHVSRCGSTLVSQLLSLDERCIVLSEVPVLDDILRLPFKKERPSPGPSPEDLFRAALRILGKRRGVQEQHLVVKFDSWHTMFFHRIRQCYPRVPAVLLYRSPREVLRSHQKQIGMQAIPNLIEPEVFGFDTQQISDLHPIPYLVRVLERCFQESLRILETDALAWPLSYHDGALTMVQQLALHSDIRLCDQAITTMKARLARHSKRPDTLFGEEPALDSGGTQMPALEELYRRLDLFAGSLPVRMHRQPQ